MELRKIAAAITLASALSGCGGGGSVGDRPPLNPQEELPVGCLVKPDPGPCRAAQKRFYYDYRDNRCKPFNYGGCQGRVPFETLKACQDYCGARG